jgi:hypothetical protein
MYDMAAATHPAWMETATPKAVRAAWDATGIFDSNLQRVAQRREVLVGATFRPQQTAEPLPPPSTTALLQRYPDGNLAKLLTPEGVTTNRLLAPFLQHFLHINPSLGTHFARYMDNIFAHATDLKVAMYDAPSSSPTSSSASSITIPPIGANVEDILELPVRPNKGKRKRGRVLEEGSVRLTRPELLEKWRQKLVGA